MPAPAQADRRGEPADPCPDDDYTHARQPVESSHSSKVGPARVATERGNRAPVS
jgi:hypothetical protein